MFNRIKRGAAIGLAFPCLYSLYVTGLYLIQGPEPFQRLGTNLGVVIGTYFFGGISAGVVVGVLQPIARWRLGEELNLGPHAYQAWELEAKVGQDVRISL